MGDRRKAFAEGTPSAATIAQFSNTWAASVFKDPTLRAFSCDARIPKTTSAETFTAVTLATPDTIAAWQMFYRPAHLSSVSRQEIVSLIKVGSGVNGHIDTCHGGFVGLMLDECIGTAAEYERDEDKSTMTKYLNVTYERPCATPAVFMVTSWIERREGRKIFGKGVISNEEGTVLASGEGLFIVVPKVLGKEETISKPNL